MKIAVVVDVQNDFVTGVLGSSEAQEKYEAIKKALKTLKEDGYVIFATQDTHSPTVYFKEEDGTQRIADGYLASQEGRNLPIPHCIIGTPGHNLCPGIAMDESGKEIIPEENIVLKNTFGSFALANQLKQLTYSGKKITEIVLFGFCTDICVVSNALLIKAALPEVDIKVYKNLCVGTTEDKHRAALDVMLSCQIGVSQMDV